MRKIKFSINGVKELEKNLNVKHVSTLSITYTDEFKRIFIESYLSAQN